MAENDDPFLTRWARRKEEARRGVEVPDAVPATLSGAEPAGAESDKALSDEAADESKLIESLPDIDSMSRESDFSVFMQKGVPRALRNKALRKLWRLDPVFANLDGLNDYDEDYTAIGKGLGPVVRTLYQVGQGMGGAKPDIDAKEAKPAGELSGQAAPAEAAEHPPEAAADEAAREPAEAAEALPGSPDENQSVVVEPAVAEPAVGAGPESASPRAATPKEAPKGGSATTRRWGRFAT